MRPREYDREEVMEKMLMWAQKDDSLNLTGFCAEYLVPSSTILQWSKEPTEEGRKFQRAYNLVKDILGHRRENRLSEGSLHTKAYDLNAKVYDAFLRDEHRATLEHEIKVKAQEASQVPEHIENQLVKVFEQLKKDQSSNSDSSSISTDSKS